MSTTSTSSPPEPHSFTLLSSFLSNNFPNFKFPAIEYECKPSSASSSNDSLTYRAKFKLLGQNICAHGPFPSPEAALEASSRAALGMVAEFVRLIKCDASELTEAEREDLSMILKSLGQEAHTSALDDSSTGSLDNTTSSIGVMAVEALQQANAHLLAGQNEKIQVAVKERTDAISSKFGSVNVGDGSSSANGASIASSANSTSIASITTSTSSASNTASTQSQSTTHPQPNTTADDQSRMSRLKNRLMAEIEVIKSHHTATSNESITEPSPPRDPRISSSGASSASIDSTTPSASSVPSASTTQSVPSAPSAPPKVAMLPDPITVIHEYTDKSGLKQPVLFEDYRRQQLFGCRLQWNSRSWVSPATFRTKKEAHMQAALMACVELFGAEGYRYEGIDSSVYRGWTKASIRAECDKYIFCTSEELREKREGSSDKLRNEIDSDSNDTTTQTTSQTNLKPVDPLPNGRKYLSELNQLCQKLNWPLPVFYYASVNTVNNYFVCCVRGFHDLPLMESAPFTKKSAAKEDVAGRIYLELKGRGLLEEAARIQREKRQRLSNEQSNGNGSGQGQVSNNGHMTPMPQISPMSQMNPMSHMTQSQGHLPNPHSTTLPTHQTPSVNLNTAPFAMMQMMSMMPMLSSLMAQAAQNPGNQEIQGQVNQMWQQMMMLCMQGAGVSGNQVGGVGRIGHMGQMGQMAGQMNALNGIGQMSQMGQMSPMPMNPQTNLSSPQSHQMPHQQPQMPLQPPQPHQSHFQLPTQPHYNPPRNPQPQSTPPMSSTSRPSRRYDSYRPGGSSYRDEDDQSPLEFDQSSSFEEGEIRGRSRRSHSRDRDRDGEREREVRQSRSASQHGERRISRF